MTYVIVDTNLWLLRPTLLIDYEIIPNVKIVLLNCVLREIDFLKKREDDAAGHQARAASRTIYEWCNDKDRSMSGWMLSENCEFIIDEKTELPFQRKRGEIVPVDDQILLCAESYVHTHGQDQVFIATQDRNMIIRAKNRNIPVLDIAKWFQRGADQFFIPKITEILKWTKNGQYSLSLPVDIPGKLKGHIELWPFLGHSSEEFSSVHIRFFEQKQKKTLQSNSSPVVILSADPKLLCSVENYHTYNPALRQVSTPYWAYHAVAGSTILLPYKKHIIQIQVLDAITQRYKLYYAEPQNGPVFGCPSKESHHYDASTMGVDVDIFVPYYRTPYVFQDLGISIKILPRTNSSGAPTKFFATNIPEFLPLEPEPKSMPELATDVIVPETKPDADIEKSEEKKLPLPPRKHNLTNWWLALLIFFFGVLVYIFPFICLIAIGFLELLLSL